MSSSFLMARTTSPRPESARGPSSPGGFEEAGPDCRGPPDHDRRARSPGPASANSVLRSERRAPGLRSGAEAPRVHEPATADMTQVPGTTCPHSRSEPAPAVTALSVPAVSQCLALTVR
jgi:hypothetical protein